MFTEVPGTRAAMRAAIYWLHEGVGFAHDQAAAAAEDR